MLLSLAYTRPLFVVVRKTQRSRCNVGPWNDFTGQTQYAVRVTILQEAAFTVQGFASTNLAGD